MRADAIDLDIFGNRLRVLCDDPEGAAFLRSALRDHLIEDPAPVGFSLKVPTGKKKIHVLLDRSGFVLGRARTTEQGLAMLGSHLAALVPPPPGTVRIRGVRALMGEDSRVVLAILPLFTDPPIVERRLERESYRVIDRLAIDVAPDGTLDMSSTPWTALAVLHEVGGHAPVGLRGNPVSALLVPQPSTSHPSRAAVVQLLAALAAPTTTRDARLKVADQLSTTRLASIAPQDTALKYAALRG